MHKLLVTDHFFATIQRNPFFINVIPTQKHCLMIKEKKRRNNISKFLSTINKPWRTKTKIIQSTTYIYIYIYVVDCMIFVLVLHGLFMVLRNFEILFLLFFSLIIKQCFCVGITLIKKGFLWIVAKKWSVTSSLCIVVCWLNVDGLVFRGIKTIGLILKLKCCFISKYIWVKHSILDKKQRWIVYTR